MNRPPRIEPQSGQESVWDYPRPPRLEPAARPVRVIFSGTVIAESGRALRVLETAGPPTYYIPPEDVELDHLVAARGHSVCEWKGVASYHDLVVGERVSARAAWSYPRPRKAFRSIARYLSFYAGRAECYLGDERVLPQAGDFYGGWVTSDIVGPFKGEPDTLGW